MPQKRNPVICEAILEAARYVQQAPGQVLDAMLQEHERGIGHGYRERMVLVEAICQLSGATSLAFDLLKGLEVDTTRMRINLDATGGLLRTEALMIYLSDSLGRIEAQHLLRQVAREVSGKDRTLPEALAERRITVPEYVWSEAAQIAPAQPIIDAVLAARTPPGRHRN